MNMATLPILIKMCNEHGEFVGEIDEYRGAKCSICDRDAVAMWRGKIDIFVCYKCATDVLPRLIADAIVQPGCKMGRILDARKDMDIAFWQAVAVKGR